jgi:hypothetical protein
MPLRTATLTLLALWAAPAALAEPRALLVGVGRYQHPGIDLPAIDLDLERMRDTLNRLGIENRQIHTLLDEKATARDVVREFETWLRDGVGPSDRVVFYFSGHGSNVPDLDGDEDDGVDEVLVTHDMRRATVAGRSTLAGVVTDDQLGRLIAKVPSRDVLVIVDACHSGTVTRSFTMSNRSLTSDPVFVKSFVYPGMPEAGRSGLTRDLSRGPEPNFVSLTAAADGEKAIGTLSGGVFTTGLALTIASALASPGTLSLTEVRDRTAEYIRQKVDAREVHHPQLNGNTSLASQPLRIAAAGAARPAPNRERLLELAGAQPQRFAMSATKLEYAVNEPVTLQLQLPAAGYLNIVTVDAEDSATVLFPNKLHADNAVKAGGFSFPTADMKFDLLASEPLGPTLLVAFLTPDPINFYEQTIEDRDEKGNIRVEFSSLSHGATRAIRIAPRRGGNSAAELELRIVRNASRP